jgi:hypothetical protein
MTSPRHLGVARALSTLLAIALGISACGGNTPKGSLLEAEKVNVVALFDRSGSTKANKSQFGIENAIWPATFFPVIGDTYSLSVQPMGFSSSVKSWCKWNDADAGTENSMSQSLATCRTDIKNALKGGPSGHTAFDVALREAANSIISRSGKRYVLLVTDGEFNKGKSVNNGKDIICKESGSNQNCEALSDVVRDLSSNNVRICPIWVSPKASGAVPETLEWIQTLQRQQNLKLVEETTCPTKMILDLKASPWGLAEEVIYWYAKIVGIDYVPAGTDRIGTTKGSVTAPNGAKAMALIGLRGRNDDPVFSASPVSSVACSLTQNIYVESFEWAQSTPDATSQDVCAGAGLSSVGLAPGANSLIVLFAPAVPKITKCEPDPNGGGWLTFSPGIGKLLERKPTLVWISSTGQEVLELEDTQFEVERIYLNEDEVERLKDKDGNWTIGLAFFAGNEPDDGLSSPDRLAFNSVKTSIDGDGSYSLPLRGVNVNLPGSNTDLCVPLLARGPIQKYWMLLIGLIGFMALLIAKRIIDSQRIDLAGDLAILDGTGSRSVASSSISGGSPSWFNVGDRGKIEPGKSEDGKNWRLRWRGGTNVSLEPADGEAGEWSEGTVKSERGRGFIEFKRVPLIGGSETNTIRYTPEEGTKMGELINKELEDPE